MKETDLLTNVDGSLMKLATVLCFMLSFSVFFCLTG